MFRPALDRRLAVPNGALFAAVLVVLAAPAAAGDLVTEGKFFSCLSAQWLDDFTTFAVNNDMAGIEAYLTGDKCLLLKPNLPVTVTEAPGSLGPTTTFTIQGIQFYAPNEELVLK